MIANVVESIAKMTLVPSVEKTKGNVFDLHNTVVVDELVRKYRKISPLLGKIEGIIDHQSTLRSVKEGFSIR